MAKLNGITINKENGGMGRQAASEDPISGLIFAGMNLTFGTDDGNVGGFEGVPSGTPTAYIKKFTYVEELEDCGIVFTEERDSDGNPQSVTDDAELAKNVLHYHISEFFRMNEGGTLYVMVKAGESAVVAADLSTLQIYANGSMRQCGVFNSEFGTTLTAAALKTELATLEEGGMPMSVVVTTSGEGKTVTQLKSMATRVKEQCYVSVLVGCDFSTELASWLGDYAYYGCIGAIMGAISKASVHESIAWVQKFPLGFTTPALTNGTAIKNVAKTDQEQLNEGCIFVRIHTGDSDCYFNDSHTLDLATSDYAYIENVRTMDKACRGIRANLLPYLNSPIKVDADSGKLSADVVAFLETTAGKALEDMEKAGELSGYKVEIDPEQNVLSTSTVEVVIKQVGVGVMRKVNVKIGFATKL